MKFYQSWLDMEKMIKTAISNILPHGNKVLKPWL